MFQRNLQDLSLSRSIFPQIVLPFDIFFDTEMSFREAILNFVVRFDAEELDRAQEDSFELQPPDHGKKRMHK